MWRAIASNALTMLVVGLFLMGGLILWGQSQYKAEGPLETAICLQVRSGSNMTRVSQELEDQGAIRNATLFRMAADYTDRAQQLKAGSFLVREGASMEQIIAEITSSGASTCGSEIEYRIGVTRAQTRVRELNPATLDFDEIASFDALEEEAPAAYTEKRSEADTRYRVSLAEGVTSWQVVEALKSFEALTGEVTEIPAEGMLAPDSYDVVAGQDRNDVLKAMQDKQQLRINAAWENRQDGLPLESPEEMLILASIIEKETGVPEERGQVASVFVNRLNQGMRLQTDPTVIYGVTKGQGTLGRGLRRSELNRPTPWNTYQIDGLPPTPIANPGLASLEAAVAPDDTSFVFFVADGTGGHAFAETLQEHNRNVAKWREIEAERNSGN
ncbi:MULTISPECIES: endolytic transglycosylase MltG [unclassified Ruegeria]|uniref:endolytic transglycosylase MltG n=1 Tax=unclassified Ruegeria TaxID=2625375 RepID=UPI001489B05D|nr:MULTISPECIES: endolytic transglycosylase MltG [unclassified Ruegeria]NOD77323.1 endolytic transglycosylase MltG [Ruegeria sp. HKCCD4332]NOD87746.1 endolytic transglycosylase MltG [Ruegeria sp. HKCCD4318]NOD91841.1 endolytic transglycosylase MltG [Ruegeria sp. HKCCD4884]NOE14116.1 endolytic transglycosylase MltG [Ruegeria sp. HKCCD4318-2]NOG08527.1 endolytic transglycosylase MltG [Ruegeria sp. HKCCD4315]